MTNRYELLLFDFDGVLADSVHVKTKAFGQLFEEHGPEIMDRVVTHHNENGGMSRFDKFKVYQEDFLGLEMTPAIMDDLCNRFAALVVDGVVESEEIPGTSAFLKRWTKAFPSYIISATPQEEIRLIAKRRGMDTHFAGIYGSPTSKGEHVARLLKQTGTAPGQCVFFGDAVSDLRAAEQNGVDFIGIVSGPDSALLKAASHIRHVRDFHEVATLPEFSD